MNGTGIIITLLAFVAFWVYRSTKTHDTKEGAGNREISKEERQSSKYVWETVWHFIVAILVINIVFGVFSGNSAGDGQVNLFPEDSSYKNYRLDAWFVVSDNYFPLFIKDTYEVSNVYWAEDGEQEIKVSNCSLKEGQQKDCEIGDEMYRVEIASIGCMSNGPDEC
jgi:hypothetical protein